MIRWKLISTVGFAIGLLGIAAAAAPAALAQEAAREAPPVARMELRSFAIHHADPMQLARDLANLVVVDPEIRIVADPRTSRLVVRGDAETIASIEKVIEELDVPSMEADTGLETVILAPKNRPVETLYDAVKMQLSALGRVVLDKARNALVLRDTAEAVDKVRSVVNELDVAPASLFLRFLVLGPEGTDVEGDPDARKIVAELAATGLEGYGIMSRAAVRVIEGERFTTGGFFAWGNLEIEGAVRMLAETQGAEIDLRARMTTLVRQASEVEPTGAPGQFQGPRRAEFGSTVRAPLEHLIVVGLAPAGEDGSRPIVLAIRASAD